MDPTSLLADKIGSAAEPRDGLGGGVVSAARRVVLASGSPRRHQFLSWLGIEHEVRPADIDETAAEGEAPRDYVTRIALAKAHAACAQDARDGDERLVVLAADTIVVSPDGEILGKPNDAADAAQMLRVLSGRQHHAMTAHCVAVSGPSPTSEVEVTETSVWFRQLTDDEIARYVATGEPLDKAGAYGIQGAGGLLIDRIDGSPANVAGLCPTTTLRLLRSFDAC